MFAELSGYGRYEAACYDHYAWILAQQREAWLFSRTAEKRRAAVARTKAWRAANPEKHRAGRRTQSKRDRARGALWRQRYPEKARKARARYRDQNRAHMREVWVRSSATYRKRKLTVSP
jgi:hypothetical protein